MGRNFSKMPEVGGGNKKDVIPAFWDSLSASFRVLGQLPAEPEIWPILGFRAKRPKRACRTPKNVSGPYFGLGGELVDVFGVPKGVLGGVDGSSGGSRALVDPF